MVDGKKPKPRTTPNFVDLRDVHQAQPGLIQDVLQPVRNIQKTRRLSWIRSMLAERKGVARIRLITVTALILTCCLLLIGAWLFTKPDGQAAPLPSSFTKSVGFPVYYPQSLAQDCTLDHSSVHVADQVLFYAFIDRTGHINVSEQAAPTNPPDFQALQKTNTSLKSLDILGGQAVYGMAENSPVAVLLTNTTLVNINASHNVPLVDVAKLIESMSPID